jgi:DNA topoisomerase-1
MKSKQVERITKLKENLAKRKRRDSVSVEKMKLRISIQKETRDYNLSTSLKSYVDPRIYYEWGKKVAYDWKYYYPKSLHNKFSWLDCQDDSKEEEQNRLS